MDENIQLPHGFRFNPFEEELINLYLKPKVLGQKLSCNVVEEKQVYGPNANPWQVFHPENHSWILSEVTPGKFEKVTYVFVNLTKKGAVDRSKKIKTGRENYIKKAGCGTWDGQTKRVEIKDTNGDVIGEKRFLVFEINDAEDLDLDLDLSKVGYWKMHEYHLGGVNENVINSNNTVLCKITLDSSRNPSIKLRLKTNHKKATNVDSGIVDANQGDDDVVVSDKDKGKQGFETCDTEECMNIQENIVVTPSEQLVTGYSKPVSSDCLWPGIKKEGGTQDLTTTNLGKRKLNVETITQNSRSVSSGCCCAAKHDDDHQKTSKEAGGRGELISNFINFL